MSVIRKVYTYYNQHGLRATIRKIKSVIMRKGVKNVVQQLVGPSKINVSEALDYIVNTTTIPFSRDDYEQFKNGPVYLNWIIPEVGAGSGGHINIFRFISMLQKRGIRNRVYSIKPSNIVTSAEFSAFVRANYGVDPDELELYCGTDNIVFAHGTVATSWQTAYYVKNIDNTLVKFYFVQDFEPYFYARGQEFVFAENTYKFGFFGITAGDWLKEKLHKEYGMGTASVGFSYDRAMYVPVKKRDDIKRIFFYARPITSRRGFQIGLLALTELYRRIPDIYVIFAGGDVGEYEIPFSHMNAGILPLNELSDLYGQCDMCLVLSATNLSLLPLEIMASNSVVVSNRGANNEWLLNSQNAVLTDNDVFDIADKMEYFFNHKDELAKIRAYGLKFAQGTDWETEGDKAREIVLRQIKEGEKRRLEESDEL